MGFFKTLKGEKAPSDLANHEHLSNSSSEKRRLFGNSPSSETAFESPPGPPPSQSQFSNPPPYHDWTSVPDTSLLPPPPAIPNTASPTTNASYDAATTARTWCRQNLPYRPSVPSPQILLASQNGDIALEKPRGFRGEVRQSLSAGGGTKYYIKTHPRSTDTTLLSNLPLYFARSPQTDTRTFYYTARIVSLPHPDSSSLAVGFAAKPYPTNRLPGWHRASLAVHSDDGRKYVNDAWGGVDFVAPFRQGEIVGIGMTFHEPGKAEAFFTRNGVEERKWWVDEERDAEKDEGVDGLLGDLDLYAAVGVYGGLEIEVKFGGHEWASR